MLYLVLSTSLLLISGQTETRQFDMTLNFHAVHQFDASLNDGGDVGMNRIGFELRWDEKFTESDDIAFRFQTQHDNWNFAGTSGMAAQDPFDKINTVEIGAQWYHSVSPKTTWFFGSLIRSSYEHDFNDGLVFSGNIGLIHNYSSTLTYGFGLGAMGQVHDDAKIFPVLILNWEINPDLRLTSDISTRFGSRIGVELVYTGRKDWTVGVGISSEYGRFSLDNSGVAPSGAAEVTSMPLSLRATYHASSTFDLTFYGGVVFAGRIEVIDQQGVELLGQDYDPVGAFGIIGQFRF